MIKMTNGENSLTVNPSSLIARVMSVDRSRALCINSVGARTFRFLIYGRYCVDWRDGQLAVGMRRAHGVLKSKISSKVLIAPGE
jgi:hypothetical protein